MPAVQTLQIDGLAALERTLRDIDVLLDQKMGSTLRAVVEPVRAEAETLAVARIRRVGIPWSRMRVGITVRSVYVAPVQHGRKSRVNPRLRRANFADLLLDRAMEPALLANEPKVIAGLEAVIDDVERRWAR